MHKIEIVILTGISGSGKTSALKVLEDSGYYCIDNIPVSLAPAFIDILEKSNSEIVRVAMGIDAREILSLTDIPAIRDSLVEKGHILKIVFIDASNAVILLRYSETRRKHPLAGDGNIPAAIERERTLLSPIRMIADFIVDTSTLNVHSFRKQFLDLLASDVPRRMTVNLISFGFKYGAPINADTVFDVRFVANPYFVPELKQKTGIDSEIKEFILAHPASSIAIGRIIDLILHLIPLYESEGKSYLTIGIGCTGGKHRSVAVVEMLHERIASSLPSISLNIVHRDIATDRVKS